MLIVQQMYKMGVVIENPDLIQLITTDLIYKTGFKSSA